MHADCFGFREFKTVSIHPVLQFIQCLLKMSLNDVKKLGTISYEEVVHVKRAFDTRGYVFNDRVNFQCKECNREYVCFLVEHPYPGQIHDIYVNRRNLSEESTRCSIKLVSQKSHSLNFHSKTYKHTNPGSLFFKICSVTEIL